MAPSPYIGLTLLVFVIIILLINLYFTWWLYDNYRSSQNNFEDVKSEIKKINDSIMQETGLESPHEQETTSSQKVETKKKNYKSMMDFFNSKRSSSKSTTSA
jgi:regulatory protein YycI of two-component signal transduction system YycFG